MRWLAPVSAVLLVALGVLAVLAGGADDSPGLQGLGVLLVLGVVLAAVRRSRTPGRMP